MQLCGGDGFHYPLRRRFVDQLRHILQRNLHTAVPAARQQIPGIQIIEVTIIIVMILHRPDNIMLLIQTQRIRCYSKNRCELPDRIFHKKAPQLQQNSYISYFNDNGFRPGLLWSLSHGSYAALSERSLVLFQSPAAAAVVYTEIYQ
ncbi:hypothetical protein D3C80_1260880 [compost metagenome]